MENKDILVSITKIKLCKFFVKKSNKRHSIEEILTENPLLKTDIVADLLLHRTKIFHRGFNINNLTWYYWLTDEAYEVASGFYNEILRITENEKQFAITDRPIN